MTSKKGRPRIHAVREISLWPDVTVLSQGKEMTIAVSILSEEEVKRISDKNLSLITFNQIREHAAAV